MPEGASRWRRDEPYLGDEESDEARLGTTGRLSKHVAHGQLSRLDHHLSGVGLDAVSAVGAAAVQRLRVVVRSGVGERHRPFANHEQQAQCSDLHYSPVSLETEV